MMNFKEIKKKTFFVYYLIGSISLIIGYFVFCLCYLITNTIHYSVLFQYIVVFIFKYFCYKKFVFKQLNLIKYFFVVLILFFLNNLYLYYTSINFNSEQLIFISQLIYIISTSIIGFIFFKKI
jgi:hypothetical protein